MCCILFAFFIVIIFLTFNNLLSLFYKITYLMLRIIMFIKDTTNCI